MYLHLKQYSGTCTLVPLQDELRKSKKKIEKHSHAVYKEKMGEGKCRQCCFSDVVDDCGGA